MPSNSIFPLPVRRDAEIHQTLLASREKIQAMSNQPRVPRQADLVQTADMLQKIHSTTVDYIAGSGKKPAQDETALLGRIQHLIDTGRAVRKHPDETRYRGYHSLKWRNLRSLENLDHALANIEKILKLPEPERRPFST